MNVTPELKLMTALVKSAFHDAKRGNAENKRKARLWLAGYDAPVPFETVSALTDIPFEVVMGKAWERLV